jgi:hypothetical protein
MITRNDIRAEFWRRARKAGKSPAAALANVNAKCASGEPLYTRSIPHKFGMFSEYRRDADSIYLEYARDAVRFVGYADELESGSISHRGWFTDNDSQDEVYRGAVFQLPARNGRARFLPGYLESCNCGFVVDTSRGAICEADPAAERESQRRYIGKQHWNPDMESESYWLTCAMESARREAALSADSMAETAAESAREYNEAWREGSEFAALGEDVESARREALDILAERRTVKGTEAPTLCAVIRAKVESLLSDIREAREKREQLRDAWRPENLEAAFKDGAGIA